MVLVNPTANSINADFHFVPTVHLQNTEGAAVKAYAATAGSTASIAQSTLVFDAVAPLTAAFSSRGPLRAGGGDVLKPDVIAPGQDILAGVAPPNNNGRLFDIYSGTSMSSPHVAGLDALLDLVALGTVADVVKLDANNRRLVAQGLKRIRSGRMQPGLAALFKEKYPGWSPMAIKSALMTTAYDVLDGGTPAPNTNPVLIFRQGAGHVQPKKMLDPGVVYDSNFTDWLRSRR